MSENPFVSVYRVYYMSIDNILIWICKETVCNYLFVHIIRGRWR
jgi:hypothetical protein